MLGQQLMPVAQQDRTLDQPFKLAHIARKGITGQLRQCAVGQHDGGAAKAQVLVAK